MSRTLGELCGQVLQILQKSPGYQGFYTPDKVRDAAQEAIDYVSTKMAESETGGWIEETRLYDTVTGQALVPLEDDILMVKVARYLTGNVYTPIIYDEARESAVYVGSSGVTQYPSRYRIQGDNIYFNPPLGVAGPQFLQLEVCVLPAKMVSDGQIVPAKFNRALQHYIKYRTASVLASAVGKFNKEWAQYEQDWFDVMLRMVNKRVNSPAYVRDFEG